MNVYAGGGVVAGTPGRYDSVPAIIERRFLTRSVRDDPVMKPKTGIWVRFGDELKFGDGRARLLELIDKHGALLRAAAGVDMPYRNE